jgi:hypothetical protein
LRKLCQPATELGLHQCREGRKNSEVVLNMVESVVERFKVEDNSKSTIQPHSPAKATISAETIC